VEDSFLTVDRDDRVPEASGAYAVVVGNQKGGTGKSTTAIHLAVALLQRGYRVGTVDLDARQGTLTHFLANRRAWAATGNGPLAEPVHQAVETSTLPQRDAADADEAVRLDAALASFADCDFVVIDTAGADVSDVSACGTD
jgi:chromosome partitioning protein